MQHRNICMIIRYSCTDSAVGIIYSTVMVVYWVVATVRVKFALEHAMRALGGLVVQIYSLFNLDVRCEWVVNATARLLYPRERDPVRNAQEAGWALRQVRTGAANLAPSHPPEFDPRARSESLYRLSYPGPRRNVSNIISNDTVGNRNRDLQFRSSVPQPAAPPRPPVVLLYVEQSVARCKHFCRW